MTAALHPFARLLSSISTSLIDDLLLPRSRGALPAVIRPLSGDGRAFFSVRLVRGMPRQPAGQRGVGGNKPRGRSVNAHPENSQGNARTVNPNAAPVIRQRGVIFPHGVLAC